MISPKVMRTKVGNARVEPDRSLASESYPSVALETQNGER